LHTDRIWVLITIRQYYKLRGWGILFCSRIILLGNIASGFELCLLSFYGSKTIILAVRLDKKLFNYNMLNSFFYRSKDLDHLDNGVLSIAKYAILIHVLF
jgi:hypothetical protein